MAICVKFLGFLALVASAASWGQAVPVAPAGTIQGNTVQGVPGPLTVVPSGVALQNLNQLPAQNPGTKLCNATTGSAVPTACSDNGSPYVYNMLQIGNITAGSGLSTGVRTTNGTQLQAALTLCGTNGWICYLPGGRYEYISQTTEGSYSTGLQLPYTARGLLGDGSTATFLVQYATNYPALTLSTVNVNLSTGAMYGAKIGGFDVGYGSSQTGNTAAYTLWFGSIAYSNFYDIQTSAYLGTGTNPGYIAAVFGNGSFNQAFFGNNVQTLTLDTAQQNYILFQINSQGSSWGAVTMGSGSATNLVSLAGPAISIPVSGIDLGFFAMLAIQWTAAPSLIVADSSLSVGFAHFEGYEPTGYGPAIIQAVTAGLNFDYLDIYNWWVSSTGASGTPVVFYTYNGFGIHVNHLTLAELGGTHQTWSLQSALVQNNLAGNAPAIVQIENAIVTNSAGISASIDFTSAYTGAAFGGTGSLGASAWADLEVNTSSTPFSVGATRVLGSGNGTVQVYGADRNLTVVLNTPLTAQRSVYIQSNMTPGGTLGAYSSRMPGDQLTIVRTSNATGAFNLVVQDPGAAVTYATLSTTGTTTLIWTGQAWTSSTNAVGVTQTASTGTISASSVTNTNGVWSGRYTSSTTGTVTVGFTLPAVPVTYSCFARDITTPADAQTQTGAASQTAVSITGTTVSGDVVAWSCPGAQ